MNLMRYEPWEAARQLHSEIDRLFRHNGERDSVSDWMPAVDIREESGEYIVQADVPGVNPEEIEITMEDGVLSLSGSRESSSEENREGYRRVERVSGKFFRRFSLPDGVDPEGVTARSNNGVLEISIPKQPQAQRRRVNVKVD